VNPAPPHRRAAAIIAMWACALALLVAAPVALPATIAPVDSAAAANAADWNPGNIIDDAVFYDSNAMGSPEMQGFMEQQVKSCRSGYTCLKDYRQNTDNRPADKYCNGYTGAPNESASTIIDKVARSCGVSQKALLVLLQKEQGLVTSTAPSAWNYSAATGQGCPDTAPCDASTSGFFYQVYYGARQFEIYRLNPTSWGYQAGRYNNILYNPNGNCGTQRVYIENQATAGLYIYTPYVPNQAALNNLYGTGDGCSAYGNRNFWRTFTDWFGSTSRVNPIGNVELVEARPGEFRVAGWAFDPDTTEPIAVHVYVGSVGTAVSAELERQDVAGAYPKAGSRHGFDATIKATGSGAVDICVYAINSGPGSTTVLGCWNRTAMSGSPVGNLEAVTASGGNVVVSGWALDPDTTDSLSVHLYVGDKGTAQTADMNRADIAAAYPAYGAKHGFSATLASPPGPQSVCAYAINVGAGSNVELGCKDVVISTASDKGRVPIGNIEAVSVNGAQATVSGWALDPDTSSPINVHIYVGSQGTAYIADEERADVGAAYPGLGTKHGFSKTVALPAGRSDVCVYAINDGAGGNVQLGCRTVTASAPDPGRVPIGNLEAVRVEGRTATVIGWALDPDTSEPIRVHLYVGNSGTALTADASRPDVAAAYPGLGDRHGFSQALTLPAGTSDVCAYAINNGAGGNVLVGCKKVTSQ
jgi:hypothetical protein